MFGIAGWLQRWLSESNGQAQLQKTAWKEMGLVGNLWKTPTSFRRQPALIKSVTNGVQVTYLFWWFGRLASFRGSLWFKMSGLFVAWMRCSGPQKGCNGSLALKAVTSQGNSFLSSEEPLGRKRLLFSATGKTDYLLLHLPAFVVWNKHFSQHLCARHCDRCYGWSRPIGPSWSLHSNKSPT